MRKLVDFSSADVDDAWIKAFPVLQGFPDVVFPLMRHLFKENYDVDQLKNTSNKNLISLINRHVENKIISKNVLPKPPVFIHRSSITEKMQKIQDYISSFLYNHTDIKPFKIRKDSSMKTLMTTAQIIVMQILIKTKCAIPIKCLEAVVLAIYLTNKFLTTERFVITFHTEMNQVVYKHVVLGVCHNKLYGSLGLSRKDNLMYKHVKFESLYALIDEFIRCYSSHDHQGIVLYLRVVLKVYIGLPINRDEYSNVPIVWKHHCFLVHKLERKEFQGEIDIYENKHLIKK